MDTRTRRMGRCTLIFQRTRRSSRMVSWREWRTLKPKNRRRMKRAKRETRRTLLCGRPPSPTSPNGHHHGEKADLGGTLNVQLWQFPSWARRWTSIRVVSTWFSHITKTNWHSPKRTTMKPSGQTTFCTWGICTSRVWRCQNLSKTSSLSSKCWRTVQQEWSNCTSSCTDTTWS